MDGGLDGVPGSLLHTHVFRTYLSLDLGALAFESLVSITFCRVVVAHEASLRSLGVYGFMVDYIADTLYGLDFFRF